MTQWNPIEELPSHLWARLRRQPHPKWIPLMLATLVEQPFSRSGWLFEPKFDGERCLAIQSEGNVQLFSRNEVTAFGKQKAIRFAVDGEIVAFEGDVSSFAKLQPRMQVRHPSEELIRRVPVCMYVFDLVYLHGYDTRQVPLRYRKELLRKALDFQDPVRFTEHRDTEGEAYYRQACRKSWEGVVAKNAESAYVSSRSRDWLKFKCVKEQEFVIGGYTEPKNNRVGFGALLLGYYNRGKLVYAGKVGTGFDNETLRRFGQKLAQLERKANPFSVGAPPRRGAHWVKPRLVAQIGFTEWTANGKLRHPRFLGLRFDKKPEDVVWDL
jgi:bifunctional non-homologous end joining protein LigD